jgi:hypothetical protein
VLKKRRKGVVSRPLSLYISPSHTHTLSHRTALCSFSSLTFSSDPRNFFRARYRPLAISFYYFPASSFFIPRQSEREKFSPPLPGFIPGDDFALGLFQRVFVSERAGARVHLLQANNAPPTPPPQPPPALFP